MNNNFLNQDFIPNKTRNQDIEHQKNSSNHQVLQNELVENQIIKKLTAFEYIIDESIRTHRDKRLTLTRKK